MADVDWEALRARIARAEEATRSVLSPTSKENARVLEERARRLAIRTDSAVTVEIELAFFTAAGEAFAVESRSVQTVIGGVEVDGLPRTPNVFRGVISFHGDVLPIVDLGALLTGAPSGVASRTVVVVGFKQAEIGILVDEAERVVTVPVASLDHSPQQSFPFVRGVYEGHRLVLDVNTLLQDPRLTL